MSAFFEKNVVCLHVFIETLICYEKNILDL